MKSDSEFEAELTKIKNRIENEIRAETQRLEGRFSHKLKQLEADSHKLESKYLIFSDNYQIDQKRIKAEVEAFKSMLADINSSVENRIIKLENLFNTNSSVFNQSIRSLKEITEKIEKNQNVIQENLRTILLSGQKEYDYDINQLNITIEGLKKKINKDKKTSIIFFIISVVALTVSLALSIYILI